jgi:hypothetical protein
MKSGRSLVALLGLATLTACGQAELVVTAEIEQQAEDGSTQMRALSDLEIQVLPFDRDAMFDSLTAEFPTPEPPIPDSVLQAQEEVRTAQEEWRSAETRWQAGRDRLQEITTEMEGMNRGEGRYAALFREFSDVDAEVARLERTMNSAFERFDELQKSSLAAIEEACIVQANWGDDAFAEVGDAISQRLSATGRAVMYDTTDAQGIATMELPAGVWWVHSRYELPYTELYWNLRVEVASGDPVQVRLGPDNADERQNICR